jgi:hypothetical protein
MDATESSAENYALDARPPTRYKVIVHGRIAGIPDTEAITNLTKRFSLTPELARRVLNTPGLTLKRNIELYDAAMLESALKKCGLEVTALPEQLETMADGKRASPEPLKDESIGETLASISAAGQNQAKTMDRMPGAGISGETEKGRKTYLPLSASEQIPQYTNPKHSETTESNLAGRGAPINAPSADTPPTRNASLEGDFRKHSACTLKPTTTPKSAIERFIESRWSWLLLPAGVTFLWALIASAKLYSPTPAPPEPRRNPIVSLEFQATDEERANITMACTGVTDRAVYINDRLIEQESDVRTEIMIRYSKKENWFEIDGWAHRTLPAFASVNDAHGAVSLSFDAHKIEGSFEHYYGRFSARFMLINNSRLTVQRIENDTIRHFQGTCK